MNNQKSETMKTITFEKSWETEYLDAPCGIKLEFSNEEIEAIRKHQEYAKENNVSIEMKHWNAELFDDTECEEEADFRMESPEILILSGGGLYFQAVCKHDYSLRFESEQFDLDDLEEKFSNNDLQFAIEKLRSFDPPITVTKATDENLENCFAIDVEDQSFWYENESDRDSDFEKLKAELTEFTFA